VGGDAGRVGALDGDSWRWWEENTAGVGDAPSTVASWVACWLFVALAF